MSTSKRILMFVLSTAAICLLAMQVNTSWSKQQANKLEGAWVARGITMDGDPIPFPFQYSYVLSSSASGMSATIHGTAEMGSPDCGDFDYDYNSPIIGEVVMTGPDTSVYNSYWYGIKKVAMDGCTFELIAYIGRAYGTAEFLGPDEIEKKDNFEFYLPMDDGDGDGIPDPGSTPIKTLSITTRDTRIPSPVE